MGVVHSEAHHQVRGGGSFPEDDHLVASESNIVDEEGDVVLVELSSKVLVESGLLGF